MAYTWYPRWHRRGGEYRRVRAYPTGLGQQRARATFLLTFFTPSVVQFSLGSDRWRTVATKDSTLAMTKGGSIALVPGSDPYASGEWQQETIDGDTRYWIRLDPDAVMTSAEIREVYVCPYRPAVDPDVLPHTAQALAGVLPKVLVGSWRGERIVWHDVWTLEASKVMAMLAGRTTGANSIGPLTLWTISEGAIHHMPIGPEADPSRGAWLPTYGASKIHVWAFSGKDFGLPVNIKSVEKLVVHGEFLQKEDELYFFYRWDNDDRWYKSGPHTPFPVVIPEVKGRGRLLYGLVAILDFSPDAVTPYFSHVEVPEDAWDDEGPLHEALGSDLESPQAV